MSNYIVLSLMARQHKDAEKLAARAWGESLIVTVS